MKIRPIAIHLPQYHPFDENDQWWGKGFTEWTNVTKAKPLFENHNQPKLPTALGFYDLRLEECRLEQEKLAEENGFYGFCYYHYWFNGKLLMQKPLEGKLKNPNEKFPFMLCWANENWTKIWDGSENEILVKQDYNMSDHLAHIQYLIPFFTDDRYIKINGKPVFAIYRSTQIPNLEEVIKLWQEEVQKYDIQLYILRFESFGEAGCDLMINGINAGVEFQPHSGLKTLNIKKHQEILSTKKDFKSLRDEVNIKTLKQSFNHWSAKFNNNLKNDKIESAGEVIDYKYFIEEDIKFHTSTTFHHKFYRCVCPGFDNSPRKAENFVILQNSTPQLFEKWLGEKIKLFEPYSSEENLFFVNAWNEWAEGNFLEPCRTWGSSYLNVTKKVFK